MHKLEKEDQQHIQRMIILTHPQINFEVNFPFEYVDLTHLVPRAGHHPFAAYIESLLMKEINDVVSQRCFDEHGEPIDCKHIHLAINITGFTPFMLANVRMRLGPDYFQASGIGSVTMIDDSARPFETPSQAYAGSLPALRAMTTSAWTDTEGSLLGEMAVVATIKRLLDTIDEQQRQLALKDNEISGLRAALNKAR